MPSPASSVVAMVDVLTDHASATTTAWLTAAVLLHLAGQLCRGLAWHGVLRAVWPRAQRRRVCGWHVAGSGLSGVLGARGGDAVRLALAHRGLDDAGLPALTGSLALETSSETAFGLVVTVIALSMGAGTLGPPSPAVVAAAVVLLVAAVLAGRRSARARSLGSGLREGAVILREPRRYARTILPFQVLGRVCRLASLACFLLAFGLPATVGVILAVSAAQGCGRLIPVPGLGTAAGAAGLALVVPRMAGHPVDRHALEALAMAQPLLLTSAGVLTAVALLWATAGVVAPHRVVRMLLRPQPAGA